MIIEEKQAIEDARIYGAYFLILNDKWKNNERVVLEAVKSEKRAFCDLSGTELATHGGFMMKCIIHTIQYLKFASEELRNDEEFMLKCLKFQTENREALKWIGEKLNDDKAFIFRCMREHEGMTLEHAPHKWRDDEDVVLAAVRERGAYPLKFASELLRNDKNFVMQCVNENFRSLEHASEQLLHDREFILSVVKVEGLTLAHVPHFNNDKDIVMSAVKQDGTALQYASDELRNDKEFVIAAVQQHGYALQHAPNELRNDEQVVMTAVKNKTESFYYASDSLRNNGDFILKCIGEVGAKLLSGKSVVPLKWKDDFEFMVQAVKVDRECLQHASDHLMSVPESNKILKRFARKKCLRYASNRLKKDREFEMAIQAKTPNSGTGMERVTDDQIDRLLELDIDNFDRISLEHQQSSTTNNHQQS